MPFDGTDYQTKPETHDSEPWRDVLLRAADYIEAHGWCQNRIGDIHGKVCLVGAIREVTNMGNARWDDAPLASEAFREIARYVRAPRKEGPAGWNDAPGRTAAEVCAALRACANGDPG